MSTTILPAELEALANSGKIRQIADGEFAIDGLAHRQRSGFGWLNAWFTLYIEEQDDGIQYVVLEETREQGDDCVFESYDPDEAACWIESELEDFER